jgi:hypothetical protein
MQHEKTREQEQAYSSKIIVTHAVGDRDGDGKECTIIWRVALARHTHGGRTRAHVSENIT